MVAPAPFSISEAQLVSSWLSTIFWSLFLVTFARCICALLMDEDCVQLRHPSAINWAMVAVAISFFVFGSTDCLLGLYHNIEAFVLFKGPGGSEAEFTQLSDWVNVVKGIAFCMQTLTGDGVLIVRLWVVYLRSWKVILVPLFLWFGAVACTIGVIFQEITTVTGTIGSSGTKDFIIPLWACTIPLNIVTTGFLVGRLISVDRQNLEDGVLWIRKKNSRLQRLSFIIIESGLMSTTMALITFISVLIGNSNAAYPTSNVQIQIIGIAFNLIIIRVANRGPKDRTLFTIQFATPTRSFQMDPLDIQPGTQSQDIQVVVPQSDKLSSLSSLISPHEARNRHSGVI